MTELDLKFVQVNERDLDDMDSATETGARINLYNEAGIMGNGKPKPYSLKIMAKPDSLIFSKKLTSSIRPDEMPPPDTIKDVPDNLRRLFLNSELSGIVRKNSSRLTPVQRRRLKKIISRHFDIQQWIAKSAFLKFNMNGSSGAYSLHSHFQDPALIASYIGARQSYKHKELMKQLSLIRSLIIVEDSAYIKARNRRKNRK